MRRKIIAGNWKMYKTVPEANDFARELIDKSGSSQNVDIVICPSYTALYSVCEITKNSNVKVGAQNLHWEDEGAYTGEISTAMLESTGCDYVIIGHSERRQFFGDADSNINKKLCKVLTTQLLPILCVGETIDQRKAGTTEQIIEAQVKLGLEEVNSDNIRKVTLAYEPVWAIGTGETATPEQAEQVHKYIRQLISVLYDNDIAEKIRIQYGGSVKPTNANELLRQQNIDGALIGGASLKVESFVDIIETANSL